MGRDARYVEEAEALRWETAMMRGTKVLWPRISRAAILCDADPRCAGKLEKLTIRVGPEQLADADRKVMEEALRKAKD